MSTAPRNVIQPHLSRAPSRSPFVLALSLTHFLRLSLSDSLRDSHQRDGTRIGSDEGRRRPYALGSRPWKEFGKLFVGKGVVERGRYVSRFAGRPGYRAETRAVNEGEKRSLSGLSRLACRQLTAYAHVTGRLADRDHRGVFYRPHLGHPLTTSRSVLSRSVARSLLLLRSPCSAREEAAA